MRTETTLNEVHFSFDNESQMKIFVNWFKTQGLNNLFLSNINTVKGGDQISCLSSDEKTDWGHWFELQ